jgi:hypothetical protein
MPNKNDYSTMIKLMISLILSYGSTFTDRNNKNNIKTIPFLIDVVPPSD